MTAVARTFTSIAVTVRLPPAFSTCSLNFLRSSSSARDVGLVELRDVRNRVPRVAEMLRGLAADVAPSAGARPRPTSAKSGKRNAGRRRAAPDAQRTSPDAAQDPARVLLDVFLRDASVWSGALDVVDVDADLAREAAHGRRRGRRRSRRSRRRRRWRLRRGGGSRRLPLRHRHDLSASPLRFGCVPASARLRLGFRLGRRGLLRLGLPSAAAGAVAAGVVHRQDHRADLDLVALLDLDFLDDAGNRGGHFDRGLVGLELEDRLIVRDRVADLHEHAGHVALRDVFTQLGNFEFAVIKRSPGSASRGLMSQDP